MALGILSELTVLSAGYGVLRILGLARSLVGLGLTPAAGLAVLAIVATWCVLLNVPPPGAGIAVYGVGMAGLTLLIGDWRRISSAARLLDGKQRLALLTLGLALVIPWVVMGFAFGDPGVPLSPHDGAAHAETIQAHRLGQAWTDWYPPGMGALFAAWLQAFPWVDSAQGAYDLGLSLPSLATLATFGLGLAVWRETRMAAAGALLLSFTYLYPYFPQLWSGWPLGIGLILVTGAWALSLEYLARPSVRWAAVAGLVLGGVLVVHGTELYTLAIVLPIVLVGAAGRVDWRRLPVALALAAAVAVVCAAPYLPTLLHWAGGGGAYTVGLEDASVPSGHSGDSAEGPTPFVAFALDALGIDLPVRIALLAVGLAWTLRARTGRSVAVVGLAFFLVSACFTFLSGHVPVVMHAYAVTFPWGMHYRVFMVVALAVAVLSGAGAIVALQRITQWTNRPGAGARRLARLTRLIVATWVILMTWAAIVFLEYPANLVIGYGPDDAVAMTWLHDHAAADALVVNDGFADAGIWVPYKIGLPILVERNPQRGSDDARARGLVFNNITQLDRVPEAQAAACSLHADYVYRGARESAWDARQFPPLETLRASPSLEEVFSSGEAVVFRTRLAC
jgi:hypothetical protein